MMGKRGHNEGSIYQRESDGKWVSSVNLGFGPDGKRKRKVVYGNTRKEVAEKLKVLLRDQQRGLPIVTERQTLAQFLARWLEDSVKPTVRPATYTGYEVMVRVHIVPALGRISLQQLSPQHLQAFMTHKLATGLSNRTVQYMHAVLRRALEQAYKWNLVARNVAKLVDPPRSKYHEIKPWTPDQARAFLEAVRGHRLEALYSVALALGLRRGEAIGLRWEDVDLDKGTLTVRSALQRVGGSLELLETKTDRSRRTVRLPKIASTALKVHRVRQLEERLLAGARWKETGMVFTSTIGTMLEPRNINRQFDNLVKKAGLPPIRFHDLRHTCATLLLVQGVPARVVMDLLGHSKIAVTMDTYSHVLPELQSEAADQIDRVLNRS